MIFGRPFVKRFALCYQTFSVLSGVLWPNGSMDQDETWQTGRPRLWPHFVRWEPSCPSPKRGRGSQFAARVYCGQRNGWIKMALDMEVGLGPGHC